MLSWKSLVKVFEDEIAKTTSDEFLFGLHVPFPERNLGSSAPRELLQLVEVPTKSLSLVPPLPNHKYSGLHQ